MLIQRDAAGERRDIVKVVVLDGRKDDRIERIEVKVLARDEPGNVWAEHTGCEEEGFVVPGFKDPSGPGCDFAIGHVFFGNVERRPIEVTPTDGRHGGDGAFGFGIGREAIVIEPAVGTAVGVPEVVVVPALGIVEAFTVVEDFAAAEGLVTVGTEVLGKCDDVR